MTTPYTEGPIDQRWEVVADGDDGWIVQRMGYWQRNRELPVAAPTEALWGLENERAANELADRLNELDRLRAQQQIQRDQVMDILQRANAGWLNDYKIEINGSSYIQWGKVEQDIRALFDAQDVKAELVKQLQAWRRVGRFILERWSDPESTPPLALVRLLVQRTQAAMDGTTEEGSL